MANRDDRRTARTTLGALLRNRRGNVLAIAAASMIPLAGMVGGGVDLSRMYIVKTRLQHACDAGALAGRKTMGAGTWAYQSFAARTAAEDFFDANIQESPYGATGVTKQFTESAGKVVGTASATVPMTLMRIFGRTTETLTVTCDAEMRLPNTDVMFVLDVTGSMAQKAVNTDSDTKIVGLRRAVKCFYETVARLDTDAICDAGAPSGGTTETVQIRFGFVPYNTNVNVGRLLPTSYMPDTWSYQSREPQFNNRTETAWGDPVSTPGGTRSGAGDWSGWVNVRGGFLSCPSRPSNENGVAGSITVQTDPVLSNNGTVRTWETRTYTRKDVEYRQQWSGLICYLQSRERGSGTYTVTQYRQVQSSTTTYEFNRWRYALIEHNIAPLKNGASNWNASLQLPIDSQGAMRTVQWDGCIEERSTVTGTEFDPIPANAKDLNIDMKPVSGDRTTQWGPLLRDVIFTRNYSGTWTRDEILTTNDYSNGSSYSCPTPATKMQEWRNANAFNTYVNSLTPNGNTYHDIGLLWGARLMSPTGIFDTENRYTPRGAEIERHLIFMTDGDTVTDNRGYSAYGVPWYDRRNVADPGNPGSNFNNVVNARFDAICTAVKNMNITLWVISFGTGSNNATEARLETCATPGRYFTARDSSTLQTTFRQIAEQISALRLTR